MKRQRFRRSGFALPSAIFLLVILAALAAFMVNIATTQHITSAQDVQVTTTANPSITRFPAAHAGRFGQAALPGATTLAFSGSST